MQFSKDEVNEHLVSYSDIQKLDDLECYITLPGRLPVVHMKMTREPFSVVAEASVPRDVDAVMDEDIEALLEGGDTLQGLTGNAVAALFTPAITTPVSESTANAGAVTPAQDADEAEGRGTDIEPVAAQAGQPASPVHDNAAAAPATPPELADEDQMVKPAVKVFETGVER